MVSEDGRARVIIAQVFPEVDRGDYPAKRVAGQPFVIGALLFCDSHDIPRAVLRYKHVGDETWTELPLFARGNDRFEAEVTFERLGQYEYTVHAWVDHAASWLRDAKKFRDAGVLEQVHLDTGAALFEREGRKDVAAAVRKGLLPENNVALSPRSVTEYQRTLRIDIERERAAYSAWYELFPRSLGTLQDVAAQIPAIAEMGFDVLYLPPIHPIGERNRKGKNNSKTAQPGDVGSPWAIGSKHGGHTSIEPALGTLEDFSALVKTANAQHIEVALDIAFQCAPDHPWVKEHPAWFKTRPDGSIQTAENPPKKYEDIYPFDFESEDWRNLWRALGDVFLFWCKRGVRIFRVDNPHTKSFFFWEHCIKRVRDDFPDAIFLAEAFTRPQPMYHLAKIGFSQSYTYFTWRNQKHELETFMRELVSAPVSDFYRPNLWPNTPDILSAYLQTGGKAAFQSRLILAATLGANYGVYGPAYEALEATPREDGSEEYLHSEKYEVRKRDKANAVLRPLMTLLNKIRREHLALHRNDSLRFHPTTNAQLICYSKHQADDVVIVVVNLDPHHAHSGFIDLDLAAMGFSPPASVQAHDLLSDARYLWHDTRPFVALDPKAIPAHIFALRHRYALHEPRLAKARA